MNIVFFGTPDICIPCLDFLRTHPTLNLSMIVSMPDRPAGRGKKLQSPDTVEFAKQHDISFFQTANINKEEGFLKKLENENIDLFIVFAFAQFLSNKVLNIPKQGSFNIHTSLLPKYRGAAPIQYALLNGDEQTGISIQKMVKKMDAGDLALSLPIEIDPRDNQTTLYAKLKYHAPFALEDFLKLVGKNEIQFVQQDETEVSFAPSFKKQDGKLDFKNKTSKQILNQIRGLVPWPGCFFESSKDRIKVHEATLANHKLEPNEIKNINNQLIVGTKEGSIRLRQIQLPGKKSCPDEDFLKGYRGELTINEN